MSQYQSGAVIAVQYSSDKTLWLERMPLCRLADNRYLSLTPDLDIVCEDLTQLLVRRIQPDGTFLGQETGDLFSFELAGVERLER